MKFAAPYKKKCFIKPDEYNITFSEYSTVEKLLDFISEVNDTTINIKFNKPEDIELIYPIAKLVNNIRVCIGYKEIQYVEELNKRDIPFMFDMSLLVKNYGMLDWAISVKPKSVYIADDLMYNLINVKQQCAANGIETRLILNQIPCTTPLQGSLKTAPIYRPQDFELLDNYIDVAEFNCYDNRGHYDWVKCEAQYKIWFIAHYWNKDIRFINEMVSEPIIASTIPPELATYRSNCDFACRSHGVSHCNKCARLYNIAKINEGMNLDYKPGVTQGIPSEEELLEMLKQKESKND